VKRLLSHLLNSLHRQPVDFHFFMLANGNNLDDFSLKGLYNPQTLTVSVELEISSQVHAHLIPQGISNPWVTLKADQILCDNRLFSAVQFLEIAL